MTSRTHVSLWSVLAGSSGLLIAMVSGSCGRVNFDPIPAVEDGDVIELTGAVLCAGGTRDGDVVMTDNWDELALVKDNCGGNGELTAFA